MRKLLLILFFLTTILNAQNVWYVDTELPDTGTHDGTTWATAWNRFNSSDYWGPNSTGIVWSSISAGDSIYVSGGADSVTYASSTEGAEGTVFRYTGTSNFSSGDPAVICLGKDAGHNGAFWFVNDYVSQTNVTFQNLINIKVVGLNVFGGGVGVGSGAFPATDSMMTFEDGHWVGEGLGGLIGSSTNKVAFKNMIIENLENDYPNDQDPFGFNTGLGILIDSCQIIVRNGYEIISDTLLLDGDGMTVTDTSLTDTDLSMVTDYHVNNSVWVNGYYLQITANDSNTFYGDSWQFDEIVQDNSGAVIVGATTLDDTGGESYNSNTLVGAIIELASGDTMVITSNYGTTFTGTGGWSPNSSPASYQTYVIRGGASPVSGVDWVMGGAHRDIIQISNLSSGPSTYVTISNSLIIDTRELGTGWNNIIYNYSDLVTPHISFNIYNNVIVTRKIHTNPGQIAIGRNVVGENSVKVWNNTFISKGNNGGFFTSWELDTLIVKNNIIVVDTTFNVLYNPENSEAIWDTIKKDIDYNVYATYDSIVGTTTIGASNIGSPDWDTWRSYINYDSVNYVDEHSMVMSASSITFDNKYGTNIIDYYTTVGRDSADNLWELYNFLRYDIIGTERPQGGYWDIGALEYAGGVDSLPNTFTFDTTKNATLNTVYYEQTGSLTGFDSGYAHIDRGEYSVNGVGGWKTSDIWTMTHNNDDVYLRDTTSNQYSDTSTIRLTVGSRYADWTIITMDTPSVARSLMNAPGGIRLKTSDGSLIHINISTYIPPAESDTTAPAPPTSFVAIGGTFETQFVCNWTDPVDTDLDSIRYYEGSSNDTTALVWIASIVKGAETYLRTGRTASTTYWCAVKSVDDSGNVSYFSNVDSATTAASESGTPLQNLSIVYPTQSFGQHYYDHSTVGSPGTTTIPDEITAYNTANGTNATIYRPPADYPAIGDLYWHWNEVFLDGSGYGNTEYIVDDFCTDTTYSIINVITGFYTGGIWFYWYEGPSDTTNYPETHSIYNYQWYSRKFLNVMEQYTDKYFIWWAVPSLTGGESNAGDQGRQKWFNDWMIDTLAAGIDTSYGAFPTNVYIFDVFTLMDSSNFLPLSYADSWTDSHPNAAASSYLAPIYVQQILDHARAYRRP